MKLLCIVVLACAATGALAITCQSRSSNRLQQFNGRTQNMNFPCKYNALKAQQCGIYEVTLSPGSIWRAKDYYLNTIWLGARDTVNGGDWQGRTTIKMAAKFFRTNGAKDLFEKKSGSLDTKELFEFKPEKGSSSAIVAKNGAFKLTINPWDPDEPRDHPYFIFECMHDKNITMNEYPKQMCGGLDKKKTVLQRAIEGKDYKPDQPLPDEPFLLEDRFRAIVLYYDVFMSNVVQTDEYCINASEILQNCQDFQRKLLVLRNCHEILYNKKNTECITLFTCSPMEAFNACLEWGCTGSGFDKDVTEPCERTGEAIDLCPKIAGAGNITERMIAANCYKEWSPGIMKKH